MAVPKFLLPALERLSRYMQNFYPDREFPVEFWKIEEDDVFLEALGYLPLMMGEEARAHWERLPEGFRLAFPIFWLEDDYEVNGWTALSNAGEELLPHAIAAYRRIGMNSEAGALSAALSAYRKSALDDEELESAYKSVPNEYADDERKFDTLLSFFRTNSSLFESH